MTRTQAAREAWRRTRLVGDLSPYYDAARRIFEAVRSAPQLDDDGFAKIVRRHPRARGELFSKNLLVRIYRDMCVGGALTVDEELLGRLRMKPTRTLSGVATVTVLTKPWPCPGRCVFCPTDTRMPKSYLPDEPGAQRAAQHDFDPHDQVAGRIEALHTNGHAVDKIELLILGGTWSSYSRSYQEEFVRRCLDAMNGERSATLAEAHTANETASRRNVGLVIETRPDHVDADEIRWLRTLGVTKVQLGAQSLDDRILALNRRGHDVAATRAAMTRLRAAGLKTVLHWMPNLLGATPESDRRDFARLWSDPALRPDELKIYPCSLLETAELHAHWQRGEYHPYSDDTLRTLVADLKTMVPPYCRINRVYRDIPSTDIVAGCKVSNLRQDVQRLLATQGRSCRCIRCREVRGRPIDARELRATDLVYDADASSEHFLSDTTADQELAAYLRLSLPREAIELGIAELDGAALVREVHVYGRSLRIGDSSPGSAQHAGLGTELLRRAEEKAAAAGFARLAVIAAVGTRGYYAARGFEPQGTYMVKSLAARLAARVSGSWQRRDP